MKCVLKRKLWITITNYLTCIKNVPTDLCILLQFTEAQRPSCSSPSAKPSSPNLEKLRNELTINRAAGRALEAYIVTSDDEHQNEFIHDRDKRLQFVTGFTGKKGYAAVTKKSAALWVYPEEFWTASHEVDCNWQLYKIGEDNVTITQWLIKELYTGVRVGADPKLIPSSKWEEWRRELEWSHVALIDPSSNLVDEIWTEDRPPYSTAPAFTITKDIAGLQVFEKLSTLRQNLSRMESDAMIVTALDEIAWLLNVRGRDLPYGPFVRSYLLVTQDEVQWFTPKEKVTDVVQRELNKNATISRIRIREYSDLAKEIRIKFQNWRRVIIPGPTENYAGASQSIVTQIPVSKRSIRPSPVLNLKAVKSDGEIRGMRAAGLRDSVAFVQFMAFLEQEIINGGNWTEKDIEDKLEEYRINQTDYRGRAFPLKVAFGKHGASQNYYKPSDNSTDMFIDKDSTLVIHSASHYKDGTASVARTMHYGVPTTTQIEAYSYTLAALIQMASQVFPSDLRTPELDTIAKSRLWNTGISYNHPTGHGIGFISNYVEGPININRNSKWQTNNLLPGSFLTAGPTYAQPGVFGVHLENVLEVVPADPSNDGSKRFAFSAATLVPFEEKLIEPSLLSVEEVQFINKYHERVLKEVGAELKRQSKMKPFYWLMKKTKAITPHCSSSSHSTPFIFLTHLLVCIAIFL